LTDENCGDRCIDKKYNPLSLDFNKLSDAGLMNDAYKAAGGL